MSKKLFTSDYQPKNRGRIPSKLRAVIKDNQLSAEDVRCCIKEIIVKNEIELDQYIKDKEEPLLIRIFAKALMADFKTGRLYNVETLLNRMFGLPKYDIDLTISEKQFSAAELPPQERKKLIEEMINDRDKGKSQERVVN